MPERLLTPEQVAERLQVKPSTVLGWLRSGKLPGVKPGNHWRMREADLDAYIQGLSERPQTTTTANEYAEE